MLRLVVPGLRDRGCGVPKEPSASYMVLDEVDPDRIEARRRQGLRDQTPVAGPLFSSRTTSSRASVT